MLWAPVTRLVLHWSSVRAKVGRRTLYTYLCLSIWYGARVVSRFSSVTFSLFHENVLEYLGLSHFLGSLSESARLSTIHVLCVSSHSCTTWIKQTYFRAKYHLQSAHDTKLCSGFRQLAPPPQLHAVL